MLLKSSLKINHKAVLFWLLALSIFFPPNVQGHDMDYPDWRELGEAEGSVTFNLTVSGSVPGEEGAIVSVNLKAQASVFQTKNNCTMKRSVNGTATGVDKDGGKVQSTFSCQDQNSIERYISLDVSKKLGRVHFHGGDDLNSIVFPVTVRTVANGGGNSVSETTESRLTIYLPDYTFNPTDIDGGVFETAWNGRNTSGSCSLPVALIGGPGGPLSVVSAKTIRTMGNPPSIPGKLTVGWKWGDFPKDKMSIEPVDPGVYEKWLPAPKDGKYGPYTKLQFKAELKPDDPKHGQPMGRIDFYLRDISKNKGTCTNYPVATDNDQTKDIRFTAEQPEGIKVDPDGQHAYTTRDDVTEAVVTVEATDTGAYCTIQAVCDELGLIAEDERTKAQSIAIPLDDNKNHVADYWEQEQGVFRRNQAATWDEDSNPGNQLRNGDGYTLYEEYRGFMTLQGFVRTDPQKKDLFVYDPDGLIKQWYEPYNPAKLVLHYIDPSMMKFSGAAGNSDNRWVNINSDPDLWYARQYAVYMHRGTVGDGSAGQANYSLPDPPSPQSLKYCYEVVIDQERIRTVIARANRPDLGTQLMAMEMPNTVIHEFGHVIGIDHHSYEGREEDLEYVQSIQNGENTHSGNNWDYKTTGVLDCAMRYHNTAEYHNPELVIYQTRYCGSGESWQIMVEDDQGTVRYHPANLPSHNCFGQINVKCDP